MRYIGLVGMLALGLIGCGGGTAALTAGGGTSSSFSSNSSSSSSSSSGTGLVTFLNFDGANQIIDDAPTGVSTTEEAVVRRNKLSLAARLSRSQIPLT